MAFSFVVIALDPYIYAPSSSFTTPLTTKVVMFALPLDRLCGSMLCITLHIIAVAYYEVFRTFNDDCFGRLSSVFRG
jgi:hypothetical protein